MEVLTKLFSIATKAKFYLDIIIPVLETVVQRDINGDGTIGKNSNAGRKSQ